jgi:hypothetical protein
MKIVLFMAIFGTLAAIVLLYLKNNNIKKLMIALATVSVIITFSVVGYMSRPVMPLFIAHIVLMFASWGGLIVYLFRGRYYWWVIFSPLLTIGLFLALEFLTGSRHEGI